MTELYGKEIKKKKSDYSDMNIPLAKNRGTLNWTGSRVNTKQDTVSRLQRDGNLRIDPVPLTVCLSVY